MTPRKWLRENLGKQAMGALTGTDSRAIEAAHSVLNLYAQTGDKNLLTAFGTIVSQMQPKNYHMAYHLIAMIFDWCDRSRIWLEASLPSKINLGRCKHEPVVQ
jgi:hypothetical protein